MVKAKKFKAYQTEGKWGVQIWFDDDTSIRQEPFDSEDDALAHAYENHRELRTEFHYAFQITRLVIFEVSYYTLGGNRHPYFTTSAMEYVRSKMGICRGGQCQSGVLNGTSKKFWRKWDVHHLKDLSGEEYVSLLRDVEELKGRYNWICEERPSFAGTNYSFPSWEVKELSKLDLKRVG